MTSDSELISTQAERVVDVRGRENAIGTGYESRKTKSAGEDKENDQNDTREVVRPFHNVRWIVEMLLRWSVMKMMSSVVSGSRSS